MLTVHSLEVGSHGYADMPHRCVIFICDGDVVGKGRPVYDYRWRLDDGEELGNGGCIVFVNGEYRADDAIGRLMADMDQSDPERAFNEEKAEWEANGEARGESRMQREVAQRMLKIGTYSIEEISKITGLSADQVSEASAAYEAR